ncbi:TMP-TENI-domain-containing protein [Amniculicola lignicola CBS 123094]|uniref:TMP-TENI-domain-containing protein n=1 Tax=Amniculicola lignicola CBS 123094 TaxID=1392246 RepID=A0A6A5WKL8_9PLEO|nr:TMP-TENI-domain-containing protein [Amniculicola lignicola CBS 123094]
MVDYSLYLVTDSTEAILGKRDLVQVVEQALEGGVTIVQYRDKTSDTGALIATAKALHKICLQHKIPLIINDRVDVVLAIDCEGVHLGQDDMSVASARSLLGPSKIIGATVSSIEEVQVAVDQGADYLGIGTLYATQTKKNTKSILGVNGLREILSWLGSHEKKEAREMKTVVIGGVNLSNVQRVKYQLSAPRTPSVPPKPIDGVAIVSAIMASPSPKATTAQLKLLLTTPPPFVPKAPEPHFVFHSPSDETAAIKTSTIAALKAVHAHSPLSHNMTNLVVQNFAASVALAIGASPIMSNNGLEAPDLAALRGGLVINMGTAVPDALRNHSLAIAAYNASGGPIILDPVGAGATSARKDAVAFLLASGYFSLVKGNESEIVTVARISGLSLEGIRTGMGEGEQQRGVDSSPSSLTLQQKATLVARLALRERNLVLMTGATDILSDGTHTYAISNGHAYLGLITGSGCTLGTVLSAYLAANTHAGPKSLDPLKAALAGILHFEIAAERAAKRSDVKGPGTFVPAFVDELYLCRREVVDGEGDVGWLEGVKVERVDVGE